MKTLNEIADEVYANAIEKGFHSFGDENDENAMIERFCNNLHDEVSELHTAWRENKLHEPCDKNFLMEKSGIQPLTCLEEEYADIIIRALDDCRQLGVDIQSAVERKHAFNKTRPYRHGNKKS